jgi:hypothetical protein
VLEVHPEVAPAVYTQKKEPLTVIVIVPEVTRVEPEVTLAGLTLGVQSVSTAEGIVSVVVVGPPQGPIQVIDLLTAAPVEASVYLTEPAAVASQASKWSTGTAVVKAPPGTVKQTALGSVTQVREVPLASK